METYIKSIEKIEVLAESQHFYTALLVVAVFALCAALVAVWLDSRQKSQRIKEKDDQIHECYQKHITSAADFAEMKALLINRKTRRKSP